MIAKIEHKVHGSISIHTISWTCLCYIFFCVFKKKKTVLRELLLQLFILPPTYIILKMDASFAKNQNTINKNGHDAIE